MQKPAAKSPALILVEAARTGDFGNVSPDVLTVENLTAGSFGGAAPVHFAARSGTIQNIPARLQSDRLYLARDKDGVNAIALMAFRGELPTVPANLLTEEHLTAGDTNGTTPLHAAVSAGYSSTVPVGIINERTAKIQDSQGRTFLHSAFASRFWADEARVKLGTLKRLVSVAPKGPFEGIPETVFTPENLMIQDKHGDTPLHLAVIFGQLDKIPEGALTPEAFAVKDGEGVTPRQIALRHGKASCLSTKTKKALGLYVESETALPAADEPKINPKFAQIVESVAVSNPPIPVAGPAIVASPLEQELAVATEATKSVEKPKDAQQDMFLDV